MDAAWAVLCAALCVPPDNTNPGLGGEPGACDEAGETVLSKEDNEPLEVNEEL